MPKYAEVSVPLFDLGNRSIEVKVYDGDKVYGTLYISRGSIHWHPRNVKRGYALDIETLASLAEKHGKR
jgi:hypothetical protein